MIRNTSWSKKTRSSYSGQASAALTTSALASTRAADPLSSILTPSSGGGAITTERTILPTCKRKRRQEKGPDYPSASHIFFNNLRLEAISINI